jgi:hypothetical protein
VCSSDLIDACVAVGHDPAKIKIASFEAYPFGNWKAKCTVFADEQAIAQFWLSFRRLHKRSHLRSPRFNIDTSEDISNALHRLPS